MDASRKSVPISAPDSYELSEIPHRQNGNSHLLPNLKVFKQVRLDNDASEVDILGHFGTIWKILRRVWSVFLVIFSHNRLIEKTRYGQTDGRTNPLIEMRRRI